jgi:hypothetical protein
MWVIIRGSPPPQQLLLKVNHLLLSSFCLPCNVDDLQSTSMLAQLQRLVEGLDGSQWSYGWMPAGQVEAVVALLYATAYRSVGKPVVAINHLEKAEALVDHFLKEQHFNLQVRARSSGCSCP